jgi:hypothetical protein
LSQPTAEAGLNLKKAAYSFSKLSSSKLKESKASENFKARSNQEK